MRGEGNHKIPGSFAPENMEKTGAERVKYSLACQHEDAISIKFVSYAQKCPTVLCTFAVALRKESVDRNKQKSCKGFPAIKTNVWPDDCTRQEGQNIILIPWTRAETYKFMGGETLYMDPRITLRDSTDQPQTEILALKMSPTLFQEANGS